MGGVGVAGPTVTMAGYGDTGTYLAGDYPPAVDRRGMGSGGSLDPFGQQGVIPIGEGLAGQHAAAEAMAGQPDMMDPASFVGVPEQRSVRPSRHSSRQHAARKSSRAPGVAKRRR
jgi:hypothetical protein